MNRCIVQFGKLKRSYSQILTTKCPLILKWNVIPTELLHNYACFPWWSSIAAVAAASQFITLYPLSKKLPKLTVTEVKQLKMEKVQKQQFHFKAVGFGDVILRNNSLLDSQIAQIKWAKAAASFYCPQIVFIAIYLCGFGSIVYIIKNCSNTTMNETSWLVPSLLYNYESNALLDISNGISIGLLAYSLNRRYHFLSQNNRALAMYAASIGIFSLFSSLFLPGALKIHCISSVTPYLMMNF